VIIEIYFVCVRDMLIAFPDCSGKLGITDTVPTGTLVDEGRLNFVVCFVSKLEK